MEAETVEIDYTNHRGERAARLILPMRVYFGTTTWYPRPQWLLAALDLAKHERRDFALCNIHRWESANGNG